ncbi:MAG: sortase [Anaerolineae bacterium]|nr:sortase [Anaerolineae bacterium]MDW8099155.1 sortase [Anaerolineae bacterium]
MTRPDVATATPTPVPEVLSPEPTATPNSPPVRLVIPDLGIDTPVVEVAWRIVGQGDQRRSEWQTAENAAGHHVNSANPGQAGNVVISGHHNTKGRVFEQISRDIDRREPRLRPGSEIHVYAADGHRYVYEVEQVLLLPDVGASEEERKQNASWMAPTDRPVLTLITCWPMWTNTHRVIVRAHLNAEKSATSPSTKP